MPITLKLAEKKKQPALPGKPKEKEKEPFLPDDPKAAPAPPEPVGRKHRILVVDDNPVVLKAFEIKLKANGFEVTTTPNGANVASTVEEAKAELIILDINFPASGAMQWTGFTIMQWVRHFPELAKIPVILITGSDPSAYKDKCLAAGAVAFFQKPVDYKELLAVLLKTLG
ncbi:MAG TPA: response regulator [Candidatus Acidoferrum sp.]|jgi:CheY-like chemotaxis protein|nr:response regulator [Candidatus Acidoferrum sp.]